MKRNNQTRIDMVLQEQTANMPNYDVLSGKRNKYVQTIKHIKSNN